MTNEKDKVVSLRGAAIYHSIDPFKTLTAKSYASKGECVLHDVNIDVSEGEFIYLIGRGGSGKSSFLKTLYGELPLFEGEGYVTEFDLRTLKQSQLPALRRNMGIVFQSIEVLSDRNLYDNLTFVLRATGWKDNAQIDQRATDLLDRVGLSKVRNKFPFELSGGECQKLMIARALLNSPKLILADEPTVNLDPVAAEDIVSLFHSIAASGTAVIMATHNTTLLESYPARTLLFSKGEVKEVNFED